MIRLTFSGRTTAILMAVLVMPLSASGEILSDNLANLSGGTEIVTGDTWLAGAFSTGTDDVNLGAVTLMLANTVAGTAEVSLYDDGGLVPGTLLGTLTSPGSYSSALAETTFGGSSLSLTADSTYWVVLQGLTGEFEWSWTTDESGTGVGFQPVWAVTDDAGGFWFSSDRFPLQFSVNTATTLSGDFDGDGTFGCSDVDALVAEIAAMTNSASFDLTGDGVVDTSDLDDWLAQAGAANLPSQNSYLRGDANLDGSVDGQDFVIWNANKFTSTAAWCSGDFNADGIVNGADFLEWNTQKFTSATDIGSVPEPKPAAAACLLGLLAAGALRKARSA